MEFLAGRIVPTLQQWVNSGVITATAGGAVSVTSDAVTCTPGEFIWVSTSLRMLKGGVAGDLTCSLQRINETGTWQVLGQIGQNLPGAAASVFHYMFPFFLMKNLTAGSTTIRSTLASAGSDSTLANAAQVLTIIRYFSQ